jgi:hypothetical protein
MTIKTTTVLKDFEGKDIITEDKPFTVRTVLLNALQYQSQELAPSAEQSVRAYILGSGVAQLPEVQLKSDDIVYIKARLLKLYTPLVFGQMVELLEGEKPKAPAEDEKHE